ncbi:CPBP family intramembrane glutamic endopeptidase [Rhizobium sp. YIM 134829]|uniref:CPBP family intramembrane glutamic endopeptidase n=1 Tax=Rhizobium sp. YIM 134829 TaxID=3390453 RepID=UPI00397A2509
MRIRPAGSWRPPILRTRLFGFMLLAYGISWSLWLLQDMLETSFSDNPWLGMLHLLGSLGPAAAGLCAACSSSGPRALRRLLARSLDWRAGGGLRALLWHGAAWLGPFLLLFLAQVLAQQAGANVLPGTLAVSPEFPGLPPWIYGLAVLVFYGFGEEIGWRGFALPLLQSRLHPVSATLILSVIWAVWHWPLFLFSPGLTALDAVGIAGWFASLVTGAFLLTLLFNGTGGSVFLAAVFHAAMDIAFVGPPEVAMRVGFLTVLAGVIALAILIVNGRRWAVQDPVED